MKYLDLFTGIGGFTLGIEQAYELLGREIPTMELQSQTQSGESTGQGLLSVDSGSKPTSKRIWKSECIGFSEIDKYATKIYQAHYPEHKNYGDITKINADELPDFDLLVGGFPCQAFSIAGKRRGFDDTRGTLFFEVARILKAKKPKQFILENVKGLLSHDNGQTFATIIATLDELGYDLQWQVLNSKNFGVPQNRERVYIVGHLRGTSRPEVFPIGENDAISFKENTNGRRQEGHSNALRAASQIRGSGDTLISGTKIRRLTPTECARLQGFPDDWHKIEGISDTQAYKCYGNAVTVNVVREVVTRLLNS